MWPHLEKTRSVIQKVATAELANWSVPWFWTLWPLWGVHPCFMVAFYDSISNESTAIEVGEEMAPWTWARVIFEADHSPVMVIRPMTFTKSRYNNAENLCPEAGLQLGGEMEFDKYIILCLKPKSVLHVWVDSCHLVSVAEYLCKCHFPYFSAYRSHRKPCEEEVVRKQLCTEEVTSFAQGPIRWKTICQKPNFPKF